MRQPYFSERTEQFDSLEPLEPRILLSGSPESAAIVGAFDGAESVVEKRNFVHAKRADRLIQRWDRFLGRDPGFAERLANRLRNNRFVMGFVKELVEHRRERASSVGQQQMPTEPAAPAEDGEVVAAAPTPQKPEIVLPEFELIDGAEGLASVTQSADFMSDLYQSGLRGATWDGQQIAIDPDRWVAEFADWSGGDLGWDMSAAQAAVGRVDALDGVVVSQSLGMDGMFLLETDPGFDYEMLTSGLMEIDAFKWVEPDIVLQVRDEPAYVPNDPRQDDQWAWDMIDAYEAWDITVGSRDIAVAVFDTGTDWYHEDLADNIWTNPGEIAGDGIDNDGNGFVDDVHGWNFYRNNADHTPGSHGTHVSGTVGAVGDNGIGVTGVNQQVSIIGIDVFDDQNKYTSSSRYIPAMDYIADLKAAGVNVVASNNSYGSQSNFVSSSVRTAVERNRDYNIMFVAAAGNDGHNNDQLNFMPAGQPVDNVISVAASTQSDGRASFTNYGLTTVHVAAPGTGILSTNPNDNYGGKQGTSMASPHVAGLVGLVASVAPNASYHQLRQTIFDGGDTWTARQTITGTRINAFNAVQLARTQINGSLFADADSDGVFDTGEAVVSGFNVANDRLGDWKVYVDANGDGQFNAAEAFNDVNNNGIFEQLNESFDDANGNGVWDSGETVTNDVNNNGEYDPNDTFTDANGNGVWDDAETHANVQFNGEYTLIVPAGTHDIRLHTPGAETVTAGGSGYNITITAQQQINDTDFGISETEAPTASLPLTQFFPVDGATDATFQVQYTDNLAIDPASLGNDDITVTQGGFSANATFLGYEASNQNATVTATYSFTAPGGTWDSGDGGNYTVRTNAAAIFDVSGNDTGSGTVGSIAAQIVTPLTPDITEGFESGSLGSHWHTVSESNGRIQVTSSNTPHTGTYHMTMDTSSGYALNQAILHADLAGYENVSLDFWWKDFGEEADAPDHVAVSTDQGQTWATVYTYDVAGQSDWTSASVNLDNFGLFYTDDTWIRFQQYDNVSIASDGIAIDDISVTATVDTTAPTVDSHSPSGNQADAIDSVTFVFSEGIDAASFDLSDITAFTGPTGDLSGAITGYQWLTASRLQVDFASQTAAGDYTMTLGTGITDGGGNSPATAYDAAFAITAPRITSQTPNGNVLGTQSSLTFNFNKTMDQATASTADVVSFTGPGGSDLSAAVTGVTWTDSDSLRVDFTGQTQPGVYTMVLGPDVTDTLGNAMDQDNDGTPGEATQDRYTGTFTILAPRVTSSAPAGNVTAPQNAITFDFNATMDTASFDSSDIVSFTGPGGDLLSELTSYQWNTNQQLQINYNDQLLAGNYSITIGPDITDTFGTLMDQDQDNTPGEASDTYTHNFTIINSAPEITLDSPTVSQIAILDTTPLLVLESTVTDDGNGGAGLTTTWSQISGPGTATFEDSGAADTVVSFDQLGEYELQLLADDGDLTTTTTVTVNFTDQADPPPPYAPPTGSLIVHYNLDETSGTTATDSEGADHNGTVTNAATPNWLSSGGQYGGALDLDGADDYIVIANDALINTSTHAKRTVSVWFNADDLTGRQTIFEEGGGTRGLNIYLEGSTLYFGAWDNSLGDAWSEYITQTGVTTGQWHNATLVLDAVDSSYTANAFRGYFNGVKVGEARGTELTNHSNGTGLGGVESQTIYHDGANSTGDNFDGQIDEFLLYNRALDDTEIANLYAGIGPAQNSGFIESGGLLVVEAENHDRTAVGSQGGDTWNTASSQSGFSGTGYIVAEPNDGTNVGDATTGASAEYDVSFSTTGTYYVYARLYGAGGNDDSVHIGLNGTPATYGGVGLGGGDNAWQWYDTVSGRVTVDVTEPGQHTLNVWQREDGLLVDKIILSTDSNLNPSGTGPAESDRGTATTNVGPVPDAGTDAAMSGTLTATLAGSQSDDGQPANPGAVTTQWTQVAGPGTASFVDDAATGTDVTVTQSGEYTFRMIADDGQVRTADDVTITFNNDAEAPRVDQVYVDSTSWQPVFKTALADQGMGHADMGYAMQEGAGQMATMPWGNVDRIHVVFNENVNVSQGDLEFVGVNNPAAHAIQSFSYDAGTHTASWTMVSALSNDAYAFRIVDTVTDDAGNQLDGEWTQGVSTQSGDGTAGGHFEYRMNVLLGDIDRDDAVSVLDIPLIRDRMTLSTTDADYMSMADLDGDGAIGVLDVPYIRDNMTQTLPTDDPMTNLSP